MLWMIDHSSPTLDNPSIPTKSEKDPEGTEFGQENAQQECGSSYSVWIWRGKLWVFGWRWVIVLLLFMFLWCFSSYTELQIVNCFSFFSFFKIKLSLFLSMNYLICCFVLYWDRIGFSIYFKRKWENTWIFFSFFIVDGSLWNSHLFDLTSFIHWIVLLDL